jgi:hypothetical protein
MRQQIALPSVPVNTFLISFNAATLLVVADQAKSLCKKVGISYRSPENCPFSPGNDLLLQFYAAPGAVIDCNIRAPTIPDRDSVFSFRLDVN